jgi:hypothetical protein
MHRVAIADKNFDNYSYVDAIATHESSEKGIKTRKCFKTRLLFLHSRFDQAGILLFEMNPPQEPEYYRYSQS